MAETEELTERDPWDQLPDEPARWFALFDEFRLMGPMRTLRGFYRRKRLERRGEVEEEPNKPIIHASTRWSIACRDWQWWKRAQAWDDSIRESQEAEVEAVLGHGLALAHERIIKLTMIAEKLEGYIMDPKTVRVSPYVLEQYRGVLDDIAKEKGERIKETRFTGTKGGPIQIVTEWGRGGAATDAWEHKQIDSPGEELEATIIREEMDI